MILDTFEVHSNWWIYQYTIELFFFKLLYWSESYANFQLRSCDENTTWWQSTFWANYRGEWEWSEVHESGLPGVFPVRPIPFRPFLFPPTFLNISPFAVLPPTHFAPHSAYLRWWEPSHPSAVTGRVICIRSMHNWKYAALHTPFRIYF